MLGYDSAELATLPADVTSSFAGVANPHAIAPLPHGATVVDIGCGAGTDLLLAARHVGPSGRAIGVDMTEAMRQRAAAGAAQCGFHHVDLRPGDATSLPIDPASVDIAISNGVLNLVPEKERAVAEIARCSAGGRDDRRVSVGGFRERCDHASVRLLRRNNEGTHRPPLWRGWGERVCRSRRPIER
jgi:ubiquinone/menaquinone biosynthesis C-methylase UbiE